MRIDAAKLIKLRKLDSNCIMFATFMAGFNEFGILNQAVMNHASRRAGAFLAEFFRETQHEKLPDNFVGLLELLNSTLGICDDFIIQRNSDGYRVSIATEKCRFCPVGVGGAELEGTICPFPGLFESFINGVLDNNAIKLVPVNRRFLLKNDGFCNIIYRIR